MVMGGATAPAAGDWKGVLISSASAAIEHAVLRYGGELFLLSGVSLSSLAAYGDTATLNLTNTTVEKSSHAGVVVFSVSTAPSITGCSFLQNAQTGLYVHTLPTAPSISGSFFLDNGEWGIAHYNAPVSLTNSVIETNGSGGLSLNGSGCTGQVSGCTFSGQPVGVYCVNSANSTIGGSVANANAFSGNTSYGVLNATAGTPPIIATYNNWGNPSGPSGSGTGSGDAVSDYVTYDPWMGNPQVNSFDPTSGGTGTSVTISGKNLLGATSVQFGGTACQGSPTVVTTNEITATVGTGSTGQITVTTPRGEGSSSGVFTFSETPTIDSFSPTSGTTGTVVTITGANFTGATSVAFGPEEATDFNVVSETQIMATVGTGATGKVSVTTPGGTVTSDADFTFIASQTDIAGTVTDPFGDPVEGATVCAQPYTTGGETWWCSTTGSNGSYTITVEPGYSRVKAGGAGYVEEYYNNAYDGNWATPVWVTAGQNVPNINFSMGTNGSISGQILTANPGTPLANVCVYAYRQACAPIPFRSAQTDVNGNYTIANLPPQTYYLRTHAACTTPQRYQREWYRSGGGTLICDQAEGVSVASGQNTWGIDFSLDPSDIPYPGPSFRAAGVYSSRIAGGAADSQFYAFINGPSLEDIVSVKAIGPSGTYNLSLVQLPFIEMGNFYYHTVSGSVVSEDTYTFVATDSLGRTAAVERSFTYNSTMPVVDAATMKVNDKGNQAYAETATPTLSWGAVTWPGTPGYYQVLIYDYDGKAIWHAPTIDDSPTPSVTVPAGILQPDTAYYWLVRTMDIPATGQRGQNRHASGIRYFYTGTKGLPDVSNHYILSYSVPIGWWNWFGISSTGLAPWDIQTYRVTDPDGTVYPYNPYRSRNYFLWHPMMYYCASAWPAPTPSGAYDFLLEDAEHQGTQLVDFTYNPPTPVPEGTRFPEDNVYVYTRTPTFSWTAPAVGSNNGETTYYYQLRIQDYFSRIHLYKSPTITETSFTLPAEVVALAPPGSYKWEVRTFTDPEGTNAAISSQRTVTIPPLADYTYTLPGGTGDPTDYRMFTIPLYLGTGAEMLDRMEAVLGPYNPYEWRAFAYDGVGYIEMSTSAFDALQIIPGMAFWIISLDPPQQVPLTGGAVPETTYALDLKGDSWHMIGLPWAGTAIDLANIAVTDGTNTYAITDGDNPLTGHVMWEYTGTGLYSGYEMRGAGDTLTPGTGYFFLVTSPTDVTLLIPPDNAGGYFSFSVLSEKGTQNRKLNSVYEEPPPSPPGARPIPDITVNGRDGSVTAVSGNPVSVSVTLDPGAWAGQDVDWWIGAHTPFAAPYDWYSYVYPQGWQSGIHRFMKTPLFEIASPFEVFNMPLSAGEYTFYFAVDNNADGAADLTWMDSVGVKVE